MDRDSLHEVQPKAVLEKTGNARSSTCETVHGTPRNGVFHCQTRAGQLRPFESRGMGALSCCARLRDRERNLRCMNAHRAR